MSQVSVETSVDTDPPGATVFVKPYDNPGAAWERVGVTPVRSCRVARAPLRFRIEKPGYDTLLRAAPPGQFDLKTRETRAGSLRWTLDKAGTTPAGMTWIEATGDLPRFLIDQHEVTNREFRVFVAAGGYRDRRFWTQPFSDDGRTRSWEETTKAFVDRTGQPGPSTWEAGDYPEGQDEFPVTGVSWYEAATYAAFAGKELPTVEHWQAAALRPTLGRAGTGGTRLVISLSNFNGKGPVKVASAPNTTRYEVFDLAGNAREWCWNEYGVGRAIRGGAWDDHNYMFTMVTQAPPFDRSARNGFRCVRLPNREKVPAALFARVPTPPPVRDYTKDRPASDEVFAADKVVKLYDTDHFIPRLELIQETLTWLDKYLGPVAR